MKALPHVPPHASRNTRFDLRSRRGLTLIELLACIAIVAVLAAILLVGVGGRMRAAAMKTQCASNLRSLHAATMLWSADNKGKMPDGQYWQDRATASVKSRYHITPYLNLSITGSNWEEWTDRDSVLRCSAANQLNPSRSHWGRTYSINVWACPSFEGSARADTEAYPQNLRAIARPSAMALFMDGAPYSATGNDSGYWSNVQEAHTGPSGAPNKLHYPHERSVNVVFVDGHVRSLSEAEMSDNATAASFWRANP